jgi:hypothetical protein
MASTFCPGKGIFIAIAFALCLLAAVLFPKDIPFTSHKYPPLYRPKRAKSNTSSKLTPFPPLFRDLPASPHFEDSGKYLVAVPLPQITGKLQRRQLVGL